MIKATYDNIIIKPIYEHPELSVILLDQSKKYRYDYYGLVVAVGPDYPYDMKIGDKVVFSRHEGFAFIHEDVEYRTLKEERVLGVIMEDYYSRIFKMTASELVEKIKENEYYLLNFSDNMKDIDIKIFKEDMKNLEMDSRLEK